MSKKVKTHGGGKGGSASISIIDQEATTAPLLGELLTGLAASPWGLKLVHDHLDPSARLALYRTGRAAGDFMLVTAQNATVTLGLPGPPSMAKLRAVKAALKQRGSLRTKLVLYVSQVSQASFVLGALDEAMGALDEVQISAYGEALPTTITATIGSICPNLRVLYVSNTLEPPSREHFPKLQELSIDFPFNLQFGWSANQDRLKRICRCVSPYVPQLTRLKLSGLKDIGESAQALQLLLNPTNAGARLRTLRIDVTLDDELLGLILQCAPALEELAVDRVQLASDAHVLAQTQWRQLRFEQASVSSLNFLPLAPDLQLSFTGPLQYLCCDVTSVGAATAARLKALQFSWQPACYSPTLIPKAGMVEADQPGALRLGLSLLGLRSGSSRRVCVYLDNWTMNAEVLMELQGLPQCESGCRLQLLNDLVWLDDPDLYATLLRLLPEKYTDVSLVGEDVDADLEGCLTSEQLMSICLGAPVNRAPGAPLVVRLGGCEEEVVRAIQHKMQQGVFPNVNVVRWEY